MTGRCPLLAAAQHTPPPPPPCLPKLQHSNGTPLHVPGIQNHKLALSSACRQGWGRQSMDRTGEEVPTLNSQTAHGPVARAAQICMTCRYAQIRAVRQLAPDCSPPLWNTTDNSQPSSSAVTPGRGTNLGSSAKRWKPGRHTAVVPAAMSTCTSESVKVRLHGWLGAAAAQGAVGGMRSIASRGRPGRSRREPQAPNGPPLAALALAMPMEGSSNWLA